MSSVCKDKDVDAILLGVTSSAVTVFTAFLGTFLVENNMVPVLAATLATCLSNSISDMFAVGTSFRSGIDFGQDGFKMLQIISSELLFTFPMVLTVAIITILQQNKRLSPFTFTSKTLIIAGILTYELAGIITVGKGIVKESWEDNLIRISIIFGTIIFVGVITYFLMPKSKK